jgi:hypothetical protein
MRDLQVRTQLGLELRFSRRVATRVEKLPDQEVASVQRESQVWRRQQAPYQPTRANLHSEVG